MALLNELNEYIRSLPNSRYDVIRDNKTILSLAKSRNLLDYLDKKNDAQDDFNFILAIDKKNSNIFIFIKFVNFKQEKDNGYMMIAIKNYSILELNSILALCNKKPGIEIKN